ncbi:MAG: hypoxanthine phosphoribosyltransferase [Phycisphaeraceae bacterium]|nr:hypoxanthine phosphoribosyltransferase [Phycisphaeraceae bacterium]MCB9847990.1 hypoxanthine phosphoribosyltransferase [Phycisphaeraceae bacterium]
MTVQYLESPGKTLIHRDRIAARITELGREIADDLIADLQAEGLGADAPDRVVLLPVLTGAIIFTADLVRHMPLHLSMRMVTVSSYPGASTMSKGARLRSELPTDLEGRHVLVIDDILDTGQTLGLLKDLIAEQNPASIRICVLLDKQGVERKHDITADYVGFEIPNAFVVGCGLDYDGLYRNLPDIVAIEA